MIHVEQMTERYLNFGTDLFKPDFAAYAEACSGKGFRVTRPQELSGAIRAAIETGIPSLVDIETDSKQF